MSIRVKRDVLRHFIATLAYRGTNILRDMPPEIASFRPGESVRTPVEILNHINGVLTYAHSLFVDLDNNQFRIACSSADDGDEQ